jgi:DNA-binding CsgD family transcriptional regulator
MAETDDAFTLVSDANTPAERAYAEYANRMKALANQARKEMVNTGKIEYSSSAKKTYQKEVDHLMSQLNVALKNAPRERQAQVIANAAVNAKKQANPDMKPGEIKKLSQQELTRARAAVGAKRVPITISDREWEAIQAGAISENKLTQILNHVDIDDLRQRATPRNTTSLSTAKINKISSMNSSGYSTAEIADALGVSTTTVSNYLKGKE